MMLSTSTTRWSAPLVIGCFALACGARTGLPIDGTGGASTIDKPKPCIPGQLQLQKALSTVMFVIDRSGSMGQRLSDANHQSKWELLRQGLSTTLPAVDQQVEMGALLFPNMASNDDNTCDVAGAPDLTPALGHADAINSLMQSNSPNGRTPTASAIDSAGATLQKTRAATSARAIVLATDGGPNCNPNLDPATCLCAGSSCKTPTGCLDEQRTTHAIATLSAKGIPTYVIGLGSDLQVEFGDVLNAMAVAGGRPRTGEATSYYSVASPEDLAAALVDVRDQVARCVYLSSSVPDAGGTIVVDLAGTVIPFDSSGQSGWRWSDEPNGEIVFSNQECALVSQSSVLPNATITCGDAATSSSGSTSTSSGNATGGGAFSTSSTSSASSSSKSVTSVGPE
jgi:hypothetical protein